MQLEPAAFDGELGVGTNSLLFALSVNRNGALIFLDMNAPVLNRLDTGR